MQPAAGQFWAMNENVFGVLTSPAALTCRRPRWGFYKHGGMLQAPLFWYDPGWPRTCPLCADFDVAHLAGALGLALMGFSLRGRHCLDTENGPIEGVPRVRFSSQ